MFTFLAALALFADGVVYNSRPLEHYTWNWALGFDVTDEQYSEMVGMDDEELKRYLYHTFGCIWDPEALALQKAEYALIFAKGITLKPGARAFIEKAQNEGEEVILVSSVSEEQTRIGLKNTRMEDLFSKILYTNSLEEGHTYLTDSEKVAEKLQNLGLNARVVSWWNFSI